jgi:TonB family protein
MNTTLLGANLLAYCLQIALLVAIAAIVPAIVRLRVPGLRLAYWQLLLGACLILPAVRPWRQEVLTLTTLVETPILNPAPLPPTHSAPVPYTKIALALLACGVVVRLIWLCAGFWRLARLRRHSVPLSPSTSWSAEAEILVSEAITSPVTFGFLHPVVLLPANFPDLDEAAQEAILCHEILHVRRHDWLFTIAEELVRSVFWFHPAIWWLLGEISLTREQAVDREVISLTRSRDQYLDALLAIAGAHPQLDLALAPLFLRKRHLKQRVVSIMKEVHMSKPKSFSALAAGLGILALACWLATATFPLAAAPQAVADGPGVTVDAGGTLMHRTAVFYPETARAASVQGAVTLEVTLDSSGSVADSRVLGGPIELRRAAQQAVLQWHYAMDSGATTRQVKVQFQLPATPAPTIAFRATATIEAPREVATQPRAQEQFGTISSTPRMASDPVVAEYIKRVEGSFAGKRIAKITVIGMSDALRADLLGRLPVHEGDAATMQIMQSVTKAAHDFDEHLNVGFGRTPEGDLDLLLSMPGAKPIAMPGGVLSGVPGGVNGGTPGGVIGGIIGAIPSTAPTAPPPPADGTKRIVIGGNVQQAKLISQPKPAYPALAKQARIQGVVHLSAIIGKDGSVIDLRVVSGHPLLIVAAMDAVRQWVYQTTLLNGEPVEVQTQIDVNFTLTE